MTALQAMQQHTMFWHMFPKTQQLFQILSHARIWNTRSTVFRRVFINYTLEVAPRKKYRRRFRYEQDVPDHMYPISNFPHLLLTSCNFWKFLKTAQSHPVYSPCRAVYIYIYIYIYGHVDVHRWGYFWDTLNNKNLTTAFSYLWYPLYSLCNALD